MEGVAEIRRFNRAITAHAGALDDRFLGRDRPLGAARLLWEIGPDGGEVRELRSRLRLDSGYLSRLLRTLQAAGLVDVVPGGDRRTRIARLTPAGRDERSVLDERSDDAAHRLLERLSGPQREELVKAMGVVERLLTAAAVEIRPVDPEDADARRCLAAYFDELVRRAHTGLDPATLAAAEPRHLRPPAGVLLLAYANGEAIGCGALKHRPGAPSEIKRMWIADSARGLGLGRRLLAALEARAVADGARSVRLETSKLLTEAIALYRSAGYVEVPAFNDEPFAHHWFAKELARRVAAGPPA